MPSNLKYVTRQQSNLIPDLKHSLGSIRKLLLHVESGAYQGRCKVVPGYKREISNSDLSSDEILFVGKHSIQYTKHTADLVVVSLDGVWVSLLVRELEPMALAKVRAGIRSQRENLQLGEER